MVTLQDSGNTGLPVVSATPRTDAEIVKQTNALARICLGQAGYEMPEDHEFHSAADTRSRKAWADACEIMEFLTATDPDDALANIDVDGGQG